MLEVNQIHNGDCLELLSQIDDNSIDCIICDLPYAMTACSWDILIPMDKLWEQYKRVRKNTTPIILFGKQPFTTYINMSNISEYKYEIIWKKQQATNPMCAKTRVMPIHENISIFYKEQCTYNPQMTYGHSCYGSFENENKDIGEIYDLTSKHRNCTDGSRYPVTVIEYNNVRGGIHPTQKPVELLDWLIRTYTNEGDLILDNCSGSGSLAVSAYNTNRNFICIEKDEKYYQLSKSWLKSVKSRKKLF